jgi:hypothetical protein
MSQMNDAAMQKMQQQLEDQERLARSRPPQVSPSDLTHMRDTVMAESTRIVREEIPRLVGNDQNMIENVYRRRKQEASEWNQAVEDVLKSPDA